MSSRPLSRRGGSLDLASASSQEEKPPPAPPYAPTFNRKDVVYQVRELTIASVGRRARQALPPLASPTSPERWSGPLQTPLLVLWTNVCPRGPARSSMLQPIRL